MRSNDCYLNCSTVNFDKNFSKVLIFNKRSNLRCLLCLLESGKHLLDFAVESFEKYSIDELGVFAQKSASSDIFSNFFIVF